MNERVEQARAEEARLRERLAELVTEQRVAQAEAARLDERSRLVGADPGMAEAARRQQARATRLAEQVAEARGRLRHQEAVVALLEAEADEGDAEGQP